MLRHAMRSIQNVKKMPLRHIHEADDIIAPCQKRMSPGTLYSHLYPDLRVGIEPPKLGINSANLV